VLHEDLVARSQALAASESATTREMTPTFSYPMITGAVQGGFA
jgi:hypothetical protein